MRVSQVNDKPVPMEIPVTLTTCKRQKIIIQRKTFTLIVVQTGWDTRINIDLDRVGLKQVYLPQLIMLLLQVQFFPGDHRTLC